MNDGDATVALNATFDSDLKNAIEKLKQDRVYKRLNYLSSPQGARVQMEGRGDVVILSSNNYLGLSNDPAVVAAGIDGLEKFRAGGGGAPVLFGALTGNPPLRRAVTELRRAAV